MKNNRQIAILEIISRENVETQEQLLDRLRKRGIRSTQATISRDIKALQLIKEPIGQGAYRYIAPDSSPEKPKPVHRLQTILQEGIISVDNAQNLVIVKTLPGLAPGACTALDAMHIDALVGSLAGDDTIFLAMRDVESATAFRRQIQDMLQE